MNKKIILITTMLAMLGLLFVNLAQARQYVGRYSTIFDLDGGGSINLSDVTLITSYLQSSSDSTCFDQYETKLGTAYSDADSWCSSLLGIIGATLRAGDYNAISDITNDGLVNLSDLVLLTTFYENDNGEVCHYQIVNNDSDANVPWCDGIYQGIADTIGEADGGPDLSPEAITVSPEEPIVWTETEITLQARNTGTTAFTNPEIINDFFRMLGNFEASQELLPEVSASNPIEPGETYEIVYRGQYTKLGNQNLSFVVDPWDNLDELNEYNNSITARVSTSASSDIDLSIEDIDFESDNNLPNEVGILSVTLKNNGDAITSSLGVYDVAQNFISKDFVFSGGSNDYSVDRPNKHITSSYPFHAGDTLIMSWQGYFSSAGNKSLQCEVDKYNRIAETNEENNSLTKVVVIGSDSASSYAVCDHNNDGLYNLSDIALFAGCQKTFDADDDGDHDLTDVVLYASNHDDQTWCEQYLPECAPEAEADDYSDYLTIVRTRVDQITQTSARVYWQASIGSMGEYRYATSMQGLNSVTWRSNNVFNHPDQTGNMFASMVTLSNLEPDTKYYVELKKFYMNGPNYVYGDNKIITFITLSGGDDIDVEDEVEEDIDDSPHVPVTYVDQSLTNRLRGKILLQVEDHGEAWYVRPDNGRRMYMRDGSAAYGMMRNLGLGISNADLQKIPVGIEKRFECLDSDGDGLCNKLEEGLGTDPNNSDSDGDGHDDGTEVSSNFDPLSTNKLFYDNSLINRLSGQILLQVESRGEAWYINPDDGKRYYMKDGPAAYQIMRFLSLGISNTDLSQIDIE